MKQLSFFAASPQESPSKPSLDITYWKMFIDGAARNNPGPAGAGICIFKNDRMHERHAFFLGSKTNNQAEYLALVIGLYYLKKQLKGVDEALLIVSDSQLLVRQLKGHYKVRNPELKNLHSLAHTLLRDSTYDVAHVLREDNTQADEQANKGIDKKIVLPCDIADWLRSHDISI